MTDREAYFDAVLREDFIAFLSKAFATASGTDSFMPNWHHEAIGHQLARVECGSSKRLIITMPPRYLKSITVSVAWVAWRLGRDPGLKFVCVSYSNELAQKHAGDCRAIMQTDWFRRVFPNTRLERGGGAEMDFATTKGGGRLSTSVGGTLTGRGGDIIIIDDPIKPDEAMSETVRRKVIHWYGNTLSSRLNDKTKGAILLVMQRLHEEDLAGHLLEAGGWDHLSLQAIAEGNERVSLSWDRIYERQSGDALHPAREDVAGLHALKAVMGSATFSAQYQQSPVPAEGLHVKREWFKRYKHAPRRQTGDLIVQSWDTASKDGVFNDFSVCVTALVRQRQIFVLDVFRKKLQFPDLRRRAIDLARLWKTNTLLIEDAASGAQLIQVLRHEAPQGVPTPIARKPEGDKETRFSAQTHRIEAGDLLLPEDAPWLAGFETELLGFPNLRHDDQVDALTQLLAWGWSRRGPITFVPPEIVLP